MPGPETLETLEAFGAQLVECSPLRHGALPDGIDFVLLGCGRPELSIKALGSNVSFISSLQGYVFRGGRIFAEGGGAAYLARTIWVDGRGYPGAGILPFSAMLQTTPRTPVPTRSLLEVNTWLGASGSEIRGYPSRRWRFINESDHPANSGRLTADGDLVYHQNAIGSLIHLHPAALPELMGNITRPSPYVLA